MTGLEIEYYSDSHRQEHWLEKIGSCGWAGGEFLAKILQKGTFFETVGEGSKLLLLTDGDELVSFCTYAVVDEIQPTELTPWMGFVFTFPKFRGRRCLTFLFDEIGRLLRSEGRDRIYISTDHTGLYEKYGCEFLYEQKCIYGSMSRIYVKNY